MKKLTVLSYGGDADAIVRKLMSLRCVDIRPAATDKTALSTDILHVEEEKRAADEKLASVKSALSVLAPYSLRKKTFRRTVHRVDPEAFVRDGDEDKALSVAKETEATRLRLREIEEAETRNRSLMEALAPWQDYDLPLELAGSSKTLLQLGSFPAGSDGQALLDALEDMGAYGELVSEDDKGAYVAIHYLKKDSDKLSQFFAKQGYVKLSFPEGTGTAHAAYAKAEAEIERLYGEKTAAEEHLRDLAEEIDLLEIECDLVETTVNACLQKRKLLQTKNCALLSGWIPKEREDAVLDLLSKFECACEISDPEEGEEPPVLLRNNRFASNFEWVIGMYSYPKYGTYDPTFIMSIFYFLIFGLMFADVGYGLLLAGLCFGGVKLMNPKPNLRRMLYMFGLCGISCAIMGVLFGGWFGDLPTAIMENLMGIENAKETAIGHFFSQGLIMNPIDSSMPFLVLSLAVGQVHLMAGMAINMVETWKKGHPIVALCSTIPYWVLFAGLDLMAPALFGGMGMLTLSDSPIWAQLSGIGGYVAIAGVALLFLLKGVGKKGFGGWLAGGLGGLYSLISYASDLLSYSRILALGLVAGVIAQVINLLTSLGSKGIGGFIVMLIVLIFGHILNIAINLLGTFVHAARLQYIEFFGKFYEDGGDPFTPAAPADHYTEIISAEEKP